jgi:hypothetical protein
VNRLGVAFRVLAGREPAFDMSAEARDLRDQIHAVRTGIAARLEQCLEALRERDRWINADPRRAQAWEDWRARHPVRVTPRRNPRA